MATNSFPVPASMAKKGYLSQNWAFFRALYENYEKATGLDKKDEAVRIATLMSVMSRECFRIYQHIDMSGEDRKDNAKVLDALQKHFEPTRMV